MAGLLIVVAGIDLARNLRDLTLLPRVPPTPRPAEPPAPSAASLG